MIRTAFGRLRLIGLLEGTSFLVLLLIAMPLKYMADIPIAVTWTGSIHGLLFVLYVLAILNALIVKSITVLQSLLALVAAFVPFGPFVLDKWFLKPSTK